jgi:hypothetical protein
VSPVEGTTLKGQCLKCCKMSNKVFIAKVRFFLNAPFTMKTGFSQAVNRPDFEVRTLSSSNY